MFQPFSAGSPVSQGTLPPCKQALICISLNKDINYCCSLVLQSTPAQVNEVVMEWQGILQLKRFLRKALVGRDFNRRFFVVLDRKKYLEKVISSTIQTNINLYMFRAEFLATKKLF